MVRGRRVAGCVALLVLAAVRPGVALHAGQDRPGAAYSGAPLSVAAASDLQLVWPAISDRFTRETGYAARVTFGASGSLFAQITNGAPFDVFLSADTDYPQRLVASGAAVGDTLYEYATGRLAVWARRDKGIDVSAGLRILTDPRVTRISIANPNVAPYGRAAAEAIRSAGLEQAVRGKLVFGESVSQATQFARSGDADVGIISMAAALAPALSSIGVYAEVPPSAYAPLRQAGVVTAASRHPGAHALLQFLRGEAARALLAQSGLSTGPR